MMIRLARTVEWPIRNMTAVRNIAARRERRLGIFAGVRKKQGEFTLSFSLDVFEIIICIISPFLSGAVPGPHIM